MLNVALIDESYEIIGGEKVKSSSSNIKHGIILSALATSFGVYVRKQRLGYLFMNMAVCLPDGNILKPDFIFISDANGAIVTENLNDIIRGVPDFVVEILSKSTMRRDLNVKKDIYEANGVKEYWIIDPWRESISIYLLRDGKFEFEDEYVYYTKTEWDMLEEREKATVKLEVKTAVIDDGLTVKLKEIFEWF